MSEPPALSRAAIEAAARRIGPYIWHSPVVHSPWLSAVCRGDVWLKLESVQMTGSFKLRGALNALSVWAASGSPLRHVVTASAGNHGLAIAWAAKALGFTARIHVPASAPAVRAG